MKKTIEMNKEEFINRLSTALKFVNYPDQNYLNKLDEGSNQKRLDQFK